MLKTRLTELLKIEHPILQAPMAFCAGGALASAVTNAGGLGFIGGGYGDADWLDEQFSLAGDVSVGCGFITWSIAQNPELLSMAIARQPKAMFLSFGDPRPFVDVIKSAGIQLICQVQTLKDAQNAIDVGADIIVAQGSEAGGHGEARSTFTLVPEISDYIASYAPSVVLVAAGGVADGRGLAASLMLGAEGVLVGSRFWAANEALVHPNFWQAAINATGDDTLRSKVVDIVRDRDWPSRYTINLIKNEFSDRWHGDEDNLRSDVLAKDDWKIAQQVGDVRVANAFVGQAAGLIHDVIPAAQIVEEIINDAEACLAAHA
jgi:nitronate monooxygenase